MYHENDPCDCQSESDSIPAYHSQARPWRYAKLPSLVFGVELEVLCRDVDACIALRESLPSGWLAERDGSLDGERGLEIVGPPLSFEENIKRWKPVLERALALRTVGWEAGKGYGMHVSANRAVLSPYLLGKLLVFVNHNADLSRRVAGRKAIYAGDYGQKKITQGKDQTGKYEPVALFEKRIEFRIFRSTLLWTGFMRNLEFTSASIAFCREASALELTETNFLQWLKRPERNSEFPNLAVHLGVRSSVKHNAPGKEEK